MAAMVRTKTITPARSRSIRHRVVPQRPVRRLQDRRGLDPRLVAQFELAERAAEESASSSGR
jgi:hypothetical protein